MTAKILCPTRGGEASFPNQDKAIAIAKERGATILFLYICNIKFLGLTAAPKVINVQSELEEMGEFLLVMAQERASKQGVQADSLVRQGDFTKVLREVIDQYPIETVILGSSADDTGVITREYIIKLSREISNQFCVEFIILKEGEILETIRFDSNGEECNNKDV